MQMISDFSQFETGESTQRHKSRSKACLHCRRRKMRCDGAKPSCNQCIRAERNEECEYDDGVTKTGTKVLYERLAHLEKRYRDLHASKESSQRGGGTRSNSAPGDRHSRRKGAAKMSSSSRQDTHQTLAFSSYDTVPVNGHMSQHFRAASSRSSSRSHSSSRSENSALSLTPPSCDMSYTQTNYPHTHFSGEGRNLGLEHEQIFSQILPLQDDMSLDLSYSPMAGTLGFDFPRGSGTAANLELSSAAPIPPLPMFEKELPRPAVEHMIDLFVTHSQQTGITLLPLDLTDLSNLKIPTDCIANCIFLWGAHFSKDEALHALKEHFLQRSLATLPALLHDPLGITQGVVHPHNHSRTNMACAIAASTMLATYFFAHGRNLEGSYHANTAAQLALCAGLHHSPNPVAVCVNADMREQKNTLGIESAMGIPMSPTGSGGGPSEDLLPPPKNQSDALERLHKFWNVFVLDRSWSAAGGLPAPSWRWGSSLGGITDAQNGKGAKTVITSPWPEDWGLLVLEDRENTFQMSRASASSMAASSAPVDDFLMGVDTRPTKSVLQLRAKSAALYEAATRITALRNPYDRSSCHDANFTSLQRTLSVFAKSLMPIPAHDFRAPSFSKCTLYTTHSMAHASIIRLNFALAGKAYAEGLVDRPSAIISRVGAVAPELQMQTVLEGLLGYEQVYGLDGVNSNVNGQARPNVMMEDRSVGQCAGIAAAAVDKCFASAREIVRIVSCIAPADYTFLEPVVGSCWTLASQVLLRELERIDTAESQAPDKARLISEIDALIKGLRYLGAVFPIGDTQAQKVALKLSGLTGLEPRA